MAAEILYETCKVVLEKHNHNHPGRNLFSDQRPILVRFETWVLSALCCEARRLQMSSGRVLMLMLAKHVVEVHSEVFAKHSAAEHSVAWDIFAEIINAEVVPKFASIQSLIED